jgi:hypothetical protein
VGSVHAVVRPHAAWLANGVAIRRRRTAWAEPGETGGEAIGLAHPYDEKRQPKLPFSFQAEALTSRHA